MIQRTLRRLGESGCYLISVHELARRLDPVNTPDIVTTYEYSVARGWVREDCFVIRPDLVIEWLTGLPWVVEHQSLSYTTGAQEYEILRLEKKTTLRTDAHFVLGDGAGNLYWDPEGLTQTDYIRGGWTFVSKRIFRRRAG